MPLSSRANSTPQSSLRGKVKECHLRHILWSVFFVVLFPLLVGCGVQLNPTSGWSGVITEMSLDAEKIQNETLYFGSMDGRLLALDKNGSFLWSFPSPEEDQLSALYSTPAVSNGRIYLADLDAQLGSGTIYAISSVNNYPATAGKLLWQFDLGATVVGGITVTGNTVLVGSSDGELYALEATTGTPLWSTPFIADGPIWSTPAVANGMVYIGSLDHHIYAMRLSDGTQVWKFKTGAGVASSPLVSNGKVYIGSFDRNFYALDAETGFEEWKFTAENWFWSGAVSDGERIYAGSLDGRLYALDINSGAKWWDYSTGGPIIATPALVEGHGVVVASLDESVYLLDLDSGAEVWSRNVGDRVMAPLHTSGSRVYFPTLDHTLWALEISDRRQAWTIDTETVINR